MTKTPAHTPTLFVNGPYHIQAENGPGMLPDIWAQVLPPRSGNAEERAARAATIVRAVNSHAALVEALEAVLAADGKHSQLSPSADLVTWRVPKKLRAVITAALAAAKGGA